ASSAYRWDEYDLAPQADQTPPFFRSSSERSRTRTYPPLAVLMGPPSSTSVIWPTGSMKFRVLGFRGVSHKHQDVTVHIDNVRPFRITSLACLSMPCAPGSSITIDWQVGNTNAPPFNVATVRVEAVMEAARRSRLPLATGLPNNGHATLAIPMSMPAPLNVRLMLHAERGIFFPLSDP